MGAGWGPAQRPCAQAPGQRLRRAARASTQPCTREAIWASMGPAISPKIPGPCALAHARRGCPPLSRGGATGSSRGCRAARGSRRSSTGPTVPESLGPLAPSCLSESRPMPRVPRMPPASESNPRQPSAEHQAPPHKEQPGQPPGLPCPPCGGRGGAQGAPLGRGPAALGLGLGLGQGTRPARSGRTARIGNWRQGTEQQGSRRASGMPGSTMMYRHRKGAKRCGVGRQPSGNEVNEVGHATRGLVVSAGEVAGRGGSRRGPHDALSGVSERNAATLQVQRLQ